MGEYIRSVDAGAAIAPIARRQFKRRRSDYEALGLMDAEDVSQEIWFRFMEREPNLCPDELRGRVLHHAEVLAKYGRRRRNEVVW